MTIPHDLAAALEALPADPRFRLVEGWVDRPEGAWSFKFRARLSVDPSSHVPEWSEWHLVASGSFIDRDIGIYPDADVGIAETFPHQDFNGDPLDGRPWRMGKPCLERPAAVFRRDGWDGEPSSLPDRLIWRISRLLLWIDAAAQDRLIVDGDPLELPAFPKLAQTGVLGFCETREDLDGWISLDEAWGFATISEIPGARSTSVVSEFMDRRRRRIRRISWSDAIPVNDQQADAVWLVLPEFTVFRPWRMASTWAELTLLCASVSIDLPAILADAGAHLRRIQRPKHASPVHLLIGFPLAATVGGLPQRFHWLAVSNMRLCARTDIRKGYPSTAAARRAWDTELASSNRPLEWRRSANWAPDQLRRRGEAEASVREKSILILGCGTLGAAVAENLLRMGITRMGLLDFDIFEIGNLARHLLTMADAGHGKAVRLAKRLNMAAPDADVVALPFSFPPNQSADVQRLKDWDVVVDCTASDIVLNQMAMFAWTTERIFISLAMTWRAKGLFAYSASETAFPAIDAIERFAAASPEPDTDVTENMEGIGCWHPVFPAASDDVNLWAAIGSKFVRRTILEPKKAASLYLQREDGSVERIDA